MKLSILCVVLQIVCCALLPSTSQGETRASVVEINVNSGAETVIQPGASDLQQIGERFPTDWPNEINLDGVRIHNPGEDAVESMDPRDLMIRAFRK